MKSDSNARPTVTLACHGVHRDGGMERASCEVVERLRPKWHVVVISDRCDANVDAAIRVALPKVPPLLASKVFRRRSANHLTNACGVRVAVGACAGPADVVVAQFCHAAFARNAEHLRGKGALGRLWQRINRCDAIRHERIVYGSPQLRRVIAVSRGVGREICENYGVDPARVVVVPNGVDLEAFRPASVGEKPMLRKQLGLPTSCLLASFVGGDWARKGLQDAIAAIARVEGAHLVVVGGGNNAKWRRLAEAHGASERVHFVGPQKAPQEFLRASDVYIFPSRYEAFSLSCIEAAASGLPLLVTKINGMEEFIQEGRTGYFTGRDPDEIAQRLIDLRDSPETLQRMSVAARELASSYTWDAIAQQQSKIFTAVLNEIRNSRTPYSS